MVLSDIRKALTAIPGVVGVHDLHVWISGADQPSSSLHVELGEGANSEIVRRDVVALLREQFGLDHVTVQTEQTACEEREHLHS